MKRSFWLLFILDLSGLLAILFFTYNKNGYFAVLGSALVVGLISFGNFVIYNQEHKNRDINLNQIYPDRHLYSKNEELVDITTLYEVGNIIASNLDLGTVLNLVVEKACHIANASQASVRLLDNEKQKLFLRAGYGLSKLYMEKGPLAVGESISGLAVLQKRALWAENVKKDLRIKNLNFFISEKINSFISLPLLTRDKAIGALTIYYNTGHYYSLNEIHLLSTFANQIAIAIENARLYESSVQAAITDGLTEVYNHKYFRKQLYNEYRRSERYGHPLSLIMLDVDFFKKYNDNLGHPKGDIILKEIAIVLKRSVRKMDTVFRYGGEEFGIILPETKSEESYGLGDRIRAFVADQRFEGEEKLPNGNLTISLGIATFPKDAKNDADLINKADQALYSAKKEGRNKVCLFSKENVHEG